MVRRNDPTIDEEALRQAIGRQSSHGSVLRTREDPTTDDEPAPPPEAAASEACEPRRRRLRMPDYEQTFLCVSDVQRRAGIYASEETKRKLLDVVQLLGRGNLSLTAYVDNILRHHLEFYREEINRLHKQRNSQNILLCNLLSDSGQLCIGVPARHTPAATQIFVAASRSQVSRRADDTQGLPAY